MQDHRDRASYRSRVATVQEVAATGGTSVQTTYEIHTSTATTAAGGHESTCTCSCGWRLTTPAATSNMATRVADRARTNHFQDAHPQQRDTDAALGVAQSSLLVQEPPAEHQAVVSDATKDGFAYTRSVVCTCDWERSVSGASPLETTNLARVQHRRHVGDASDGSSGRDNLALLVMLAVAAVMLIALAYIALDALPG